MRNRMSGSGAAHVGLFGRPTILRIGEDPGGGGGGGGGDEDDAKFTERFNKLFHKAMGEREKRLEQKLMKGLGETLKGQLDELREAIMAEDPGEGQPGGQPGGQPAPGGQHELSPEMRAQLKRAEDTAKEAAAKADKWEREAKAASEKSKKTEERQMIISSLNGKVKPALLDMVVDQLHGKHIVRDSEDESKILWRGADGELLPFKDGIDSWAKSDFGKEVSPPVAARGSGGRGGEGAAGKGEMNADILGGIIAGAIPR
jgi:hypothetical protein